MLAPEDEKPYADFLAALRKRWQPLKAAIYTYDASGYFRLKSQFGFSRTDKLLERFSRMDPLATHIYEHREPFFINSLRQAGKLVDVLEGAQTTKILTAPIYLDGRIIGILDIRDKGGRLPFTHEDVQELTDLLRRFMVLLKRHPQYRPEGITVQGGEGRGFAPAPDTPAHRGTSGSLPYGARGGESGIVFEMVSPDTGGPRGAPEAMERTPSPSLTSSGELHVPPVATSAAQLLRLIEETLSRIPSSKPSVPSAPGTLPSEADFSRLYLQTCLSLADVEVAAVSVYTPARLDVTYGSRRPLDADLKPALLENLEKVAAKHGPAGPFPSESSFKSLDLAIAENAEPVRRAEIAAIQSSVLAATPEGVAIFSLLFRHGPAPESREALRPAHVVLKSALSQIRNESRFREAYRGLVNKLVEPGLRRRTALKTHSFNVGRMARTFASHLGLPPLEVEQITVAAILHDVGMRELNYDELYTKRSLTDDDVRVIRQHPRVGAHLVDEIVWPYPVAPLVRHHHERWDGAGYPEGLKGERIPIGARLIHICEAYDAMTSPSSYRAVIGEGPALDIIESKSGTQFDPDLGPRFRTMLQSMPE